jgi:anti-sigma factor RsiW
MTPADTNPSCFTDFALGEFVHGRLDPEVRREVEAHAGECAECGAAIRMLRAESAAIVRALRAARLAQMDKFDPQTLARYLDGALDPQAERELEAILATEPEPLAALVALHAEVAAARLEADQGVGRIEPAVPAGQILRMPKRTAPPPLVSSTIEKLARGHG